MDRKKTCLYITKETLESLRELKRYGFNSYAMIELGVKKVMEDYKKGRMGLKNQSKETSLKTRQAI